MAVSFIKSPLVLGIGELLWDLLPDCPKLGGAPANFAFHAHALGARVAIISRIGRDPLGDGILGQLQRVGLPERWVQIDDRAPTGTVTVDLDHLGIPRFEINAPAAWDYLTINDAALELARTCDAICFGTLAQRDPAAAAAIQGLVAATRAPALRLFDINLRQNFFSRSLLEGSLALANVVKLNDHELTVLAEMFGFEGSVPRQIETLAGRFEIETVALTRGANGSLLYRAGEWSERPGKSVPVVDTVGAGDSFSAALAMGLLRKVELDRIHFVASEIAGHVCGHAGAMPKLPPTLCTSFDSKPKRASQPR